MPISSPELSQVFSVLAGMKIPEELKKGGRAHLDALCNQSGLTAYLERLDSLPAVLRESEYLPAGHNLSDKFHIKKYYDVARTAAEDSVEVVVSYGSGTSNTMGPEGDKVLSMTLKADGSVTCVRGDIVTACPETREYMARVESDDSLMLMRTKAEAFVKGAVDLEHAIEKALQVYYGLEFATTEYGSVKDAINNSLLPWIRAAVGPDRVDEVRKHMTTPPTAIVHTKYAWPR